MKRVWCTMGKRGVGRPRIQAETRRKGVERTIITQATVEIEEPVEEIEGISTLPKENCMNVDELGIYILQYDRAGYGESDPNPKRSLKSEALDIEELADLLQIGSKFYLIGVSMGSYATWSCLNYIPNRQITCLSQNMHL